MTTVMNLSNPNHKLQYSCTPREAVIAAYAQNLRPNPSVVGDWNTWQYEERYGHLVVEGKFCISCGDFSAFKDGREFQMNAEMFIQHQVSSLKYFYNSHVLGLYKYTKNYYPDLSWTEFIEYFSKVNVGEDGCEIERIK